MIVMRFGIGNGGVGIECLVFDDAMRIVAVGTLNMAVVAQIAGTFHKVFVGNAVLFAGHALIDIGDGFGVGSGKFAFYVGNFVSTSANEDVVKPTIHGMTLVAGFFLGGVSACFWGGDAVGAFS